MTGWEMRHSLMLEPKIAFGLHDAGRWRIYFKPIEGCFYGMGGDSAAGIPGRNLSALHVINLNYHRVDAVFSSNVAPESLAIEAYKAGFWYNKALIAVEAMFHGLLVNYKLMDELNYPNLFQHDGTMTSQRVRVSSEIGWKQTEPNRNLILSLLQSDLAYHVSKDLATQAKAIRIYDIPTLEEITHFHRNNKGKAEAEQGFADDNVISCAIGNALYHTMRRSLPTPPQDVKETVWQQWQKVKAQEQRLDEFALGEFVIEDPNRML